jgi:hypothetical protein
MPEPHKRPHRHPKYKTAYRVKNWHAYDQSLRDRGDLTLWISQDAIDAWSPPMTGKRGAQSVYAEALVGFQGRGRVEVVRPALCHTLLRQALLFQGPAT